MLRFRRQAIGVKIFPKVQRLKNWKNGLILTCRFTTFGNSRINPTRLTISGIASAEVPGTYLAHGQLKRRHFARHKPVNRTRGRT